MKTRLIAIPLLALAAIHAPNASGQQINIKPGLWQLDMTTPGAAKGQGNPMAGYIAGMKAQMAKMPPEQRKQLEATLAELDARGTEFTSDGVRMKECITKEDIANYDFLGKKEMDSCTRKASPTAGGMNLSMNCTRPQMSIEASVKSQGDKAYTFTSIATVPGPDGKPMTQRSSGSAKWLSSDCGKVKPASSKE